MSASIAELSSLSPPSDDGAIARALEELETKLCAWSDAMTTAQSVLVDTHRAPEDAGADVQELTPAESAQPETSESISPAEELIEPVADEGETKHTITAADSEAILNRLSEAMQHSDHLAREVGAGEETENSEPKEPSTASAATDEDIEELLATIESSVAEQLRIRHAEAGGKVSMREICDAYFAEVTETEELLATLEPEMAKAIRVQYRLFNGRKSIRQLVDAYEPPKEQSKKRKSWWRG